MNTPLTSLTSTDSREAHVLVVEDIDTTRQRLVETLRRNGFRVEEAHDGLEALKKVSARRFDAILLDLVLPHVDGWQFRETQLRHPELATIPTVVVTVRPLRESDRYALRADQIVHKPFEDDDLLAAVHRACGTRSQPIPDGAPPNPNQLFWSRRGEVACRSHAPRTESYRWHAERWTSLEDGSGKRGITYRCQHCPGADGPIAHGARDNAARRLPAPDPGPRTDGEVALVTPPACPTCEGAMTAAEREAPASNAGARVGNPSPPPLALKVWHCDACGVDRPRLD